MDEQTKINLCIACTLAEIMKDCNRCAFACGLAARAAWLKIKADNNDMVSKGV